MSPKVRLKCYPASDAAFGQHAALHLTIELPETYSPDEIVLEIQRRLRETYPLALIRAESLDDPTWHVYRDGDGEG